MTVTRQETDEDDMPWPPDDFTGEWVVEWTNGEVKFRCLYLGGKAEGKYECYWPNGTPAQLGYMEDGKAKGVWSDYWQNGVLFKETEYFGGDTFDVIIEQEREHLMDLCDLNDLLD
jgi:hypothetical protein